MKPYRPTLLSKRAEIDALDQLSTSAKAAVEPIILIHPMAEAIARPAGAKKKPKPKTIEMHLRAIAARLAKALPKGRVAAEVESQTTPDAAAIFFAEAAALGLTAVPVLPLMPSPQRARLAEIGRSGPGACLRLREEDLTPALASKVAAMLNACQMSPSSVDLVLDLGSVSGKPLAALVAYATTTLKMLPTLGAWRTVTLSLGAYPAVPTDTIPGLYTIRRLDWLAFDEIRRRKLAPRDLLFGDHATSCPDKMPPMIPINGVCAKLVYAIGKEWMHYRCDNLRTTGVQTYRKACGDLVKHVEFMGSSFSRGDADIAECAAGTVSIKTPEAMKRLALVHHMTLVADQLGLLGRANPSSPSTPRGSRTAAA